jgi:peptidoglycan/LPS O-acetylase OafA/YrhL
MAADVHTSEATKTYGRSNEGFPCFDGIRALAAVMVVVYHSVFFATRFNTPGGMFLWNLNSGVWIFFVTSGFLLYLPFAEAHLAHAPGVRVGAYALRRFMRIFPAYWAVLAFFWWVDSKMVIQGVDGFFLNVGLAKTYVHEANPFLIGLPPAWSLVIEVTFYAFLPFYAALIAAIARRANPLRTELAGVIVFGAVGLGTTIAIANGLDAPWVGVLPMHALPFALGMMLAVLVARPHVDPANPPYAWLRHGAGYWWALGTASFVAIPLLYRVRPFETPTPYQATLLYVFQSLVGFFIVVPAVFGNQSQGVIRKALRARPIVYLGLVSYGIYLWHWWILQVVLGDWLGWPLDKGNWLVVFALGFPLVVFAATISWFCLERPIQRWTRLVTRARRGYSAAN